MPSDPISPAQLPAESAEERLLRKELTDALKSLKADIPKVIEELGLEETVDIRSWMNVVNGKLLPRLSPDFPLMGAICGGGSSGKSTLFNSLVGDRLSPSGGKAGINRRILVSAPGELFRSKEFVSTLFEPFGGGSKPLEDKTELTVPGPPLYILNAKVPRNMVLMDTPDFDTGAKGTYTNREVVRQALETADILIYIFTNSNYNNQDNTDFISNVITGIGMRRSFLVYRVFSGLPDEEAIEHAMTVAHNLYGEDAERYILGIYRTDEDNAVASGAAFMELRPVRPQDPPFSEALRSLDPRTLRPELIASILKGALEKAEEVLSQTRRSRDELSLYLDGLLASQSRSVQEALRHFPMDLILGRFAKIWVEHDPGYIKAMRKTGDYISAPFRMITGAARWIGGRVYGTSPDKASKDFRDKIEEDLLSAANNLHTKTLNPEIFVTVSESDPVALRMLRITARTDAGHLEPAEEAGALAFRVQAHPAVQNAQKNLQEQEWKESLEKILAGKEAVIRLSEEIQNDLNEIAARFREEMGLTAKVRQTLSAVLNVLPATVAVTYILSTGDPVGAAGIKVKLTGLFGLQDLYALVAIPATSGLSKADRRQLETLLAPSARAWLDNNLHTVQAIFEEHITGRIIQTAQEAIERADERIEGIEAAIEECRKAIHQT